MFHVYFLIFTFFLFLKISLTIPIGSDKPDLWTTKNSLEAARLFFDHDQIDLNTAKQITKQDPKTAIYDISNPSPNKRLKQSIPKIKPVGYDSKPQRIARLASRLLKDKKVQNEKEAMILANSQLKLKMDIRNENARKYRKIRKIDPEKAKLMKTGGAKRVGYQIRENIIERHANNLINSGLASSKQSANLIAEEHCRVKAIEKQLRRANKKKLE